MSEVVVVRDGDLIEVDPLDKRLIVMDFDTDHLPPGVLIDSHSTRIEAIRPVALAVTSITRSGTTATVTTATAHGYATGDWVSINGAVQSDYNIAAQITVTGTTTFTYTVANSPATPATGTLTAAVGLGKDNASVGAADKTLGDGTVLLASRYTQLRLIGSGETWLGRRFRVSTTITTNETPAQTKDRHFEALIANL